MELPKNAPSARNHGVDLLRIVAMIMIPIYHLLGHGGIIEALTPLSLRYEAAWGLKILVVCAVNCYALISGYVGCGRRPKYSNVPYLYLQTVFYSLLATGAMKIYAPDKVGLKAVLFSFLPIYSNSYWYYRAYICLIFVMPALNMLVEKYEREGLRRLLLALFVLFTVIPTFVNSDFGGAGKGLCFLWLALLYLAGAYIKKYDVKPTFAARRGIFGYLICAAVTFFCKLGLEFLSINVLHGRFAFVQTVADRLTAYNSPAVLLCALFLLFFFANLNISQTPAKIISFFAPLTFGVYLFHEQPLIRSILIVDKFGWMTTLHPAVMIASVVGIGVAIWLVGSLVDRVRLFLFDALRVRRLCDFICAKVSSAISRIGGRSSGGETTEER